MLLLVVVVGSCRICCVFVFAVFVVVAAVVAIVAVGGVIVCWLLFVGCL